MIEIVIVKTVLVTLLIVAIPYLSKYFSVKLEGRWENRIGMVSDKTNVDFCSLAVPTSTPKLGNKHDNDEVFSPLNQFLENNNNSSSHGNSNNKTVDNLDGSGESRRKKRISLGGSISKVFSRGKTRRSLAMPQEDSNGESELFIIIFIFIIIIIIIIFIININIFIIIIFIIVVNGKQSLCGL